MKREHSRELLKAFARLADSWNRLAGEGLNRGVDKALCLKALCLTIWHDGSGRLGTRFPTATLEDRHHFDNVDELICHLEREGFDMDVPITTMEVPLMTESRIEHDPVDHPSHYTDTAVEPIDVIEAWGLGFCLGNCVKYIARAGKKAGADPIEDLEKASWYLSREIERRKKGAS